MRAPIVIAILALLTALPALGQMAACGGEERWKVKTLADPQASEVLQTIKAPVEKTVAEMIALKRPGDVNGELPRQSDDIETKTFKIAATLTIYKQEADQDYHLVLDDGHDNTMIVEIPNPDCASGSAALEYIKTARETFKNKFSNVGADLHTTKIPVVVTGVGFFDIQHGGKGQIGHAENNIELHPVLSIQFTGSVPPDFETPTCTATATEIKTAVYEPGIGMMWWVISITMTILYIVAIHETVGTLRRSNTWSLSEALQDVDRKPSSSRLIAFLGLTILMVLYMGIGYVAIWRLLNNEPLPNVNTFLLTGLSLFAPYAFNQLKQMATGTVSGAYAGTSAAASNTLPPRVLTVTPNSLTANTSTSLTVTGVGFDPKASISVTTNAAAVTPSFSLVTPTQIQLSVTMPPSSGPYNAVVHIVNPDGKEATGTFQVTP